MELLCDSDHERLDKIRKDIVDLESIKGNFSVFERMMFENAKFLLTCLTEARDHIWAIER